ncbi:MAG: isopeptide-forming domain-containing fimbrial protein [Lachnospiraceae bacterium]|nr:isopeptide-forming domain-containing fimbrial protein [Lachnospiraceae bacterium]
MKKCRKLASILLALVMVMGLGVTAMAATVNSEIVIENVASDSHTFTAYQIISGDVSGTTISNAVWGDGVDGDALITALKASTKSVTAASGTTTTLGALFASCSTVSGVMEVLETNNAYSSVVEAFAEVVQTCVTMTSKASGTPVEETDGTWTYTITGIADGYYLVVDSGAKTDESEDANSRYMIEVVNGTATITSKAVVPTIDKTITNSTGLDKTTLTTSEKGTAVSVGDTVSFELECTVPSDLGGYDTYTYIIHDTMDDGLDFPDDGDATNPQVTGTTIGLTVRSTSQSVTPLYTAVIDADARTLTITISNAKALAGETIYVEYNAVLNDNAVAGVAEDNTVYLEYSNNPNGSGTGKTPESVVHVYTFDLYTYKVDGDTQQPLSGATFTLYKSTDRGSIYTEEVAEIASTDTNDGSTFTFEELGAGYYKLVETVTPTGYNTVEDIKFQIVATYNTDGTISALSVAGNENKVSVYVAKTSVTTTVENMSGTSLPSTGGIGTTIFYVVGGILVFGAAVLLVTRRRMSRMK